MASISLISMTQNTNCLNNGSSVRRHMVGCWERMVKDMKNKLGLFVHWGLYALTAYHEQARARLKLDRYDYRKLAEKFNPTAFDPDSWVRMASEAGMEYICFTTKHHDGFCMWDTKETEFNIMNTPYKKDVLAMLAESCARHKMKLSLYYSVPDWDQAYAYNEISSHQCPPYPSDHPDSKLYRDFVRKQITELLTGYGPIYTLFWDIPPQIDDPSINQYVRQLQPDILINDRGYDPGDFSTPERHIPDGKRFSGLTEACQSVGRRSWGYRWHEDYHSLRFLKNSIDKVMAMGGSYLLNVGPMASGKIDDRSRQIIEQIGEWFCRVRTSLEDTVPSSHVTKEADPDMPFIAVDQSGSTYLHFYEGCTVSGITLPDIEKMPAAVTLFNHAIPLAFERLTLPATWHEKKLVPTAPGLHIYDIPVDDYSHEPIIIKISW